LSNTERSYEILLERIKQLEATNEKFLQFTVSMERVKEIAQALLKNLTMENMNPETKSTVKMVS
jgi:hypothetical protein